MIKPNFCNYTQRYFQRLGFLKIISVIGEGVRGGPSEINARLQARYVLPADSEDERGAKGKQVTRSGPWCPVSISRTRSVVNIKELLHRDEIPSWGAGFVQKELHRVTTWATDVGILASTGRLSDWALILRSLATEEKGLSLEEQNPFLLSQEEQSFFIQLLFYHDQVMPILISQLGAVESGSRISLGEAQLMTVMAIAAHYDALRGSSPEESKTRRVIHDVLERADRLYGFSSPGLLFSLENRAKAAEEIRKKGKKLAKRNHVAEYQTVCRFEQLTDLGLLVKGDPTNPPLTQEEIRSARTDWSWYVTPMLHSAWQIFQGISQDLEVFLKGYWMQFSAALYKTNADRLDPFTDQLEVARYLDQALPYARRQIGPVQFHTWATLACLMAFSSNKVVEIEDINRLLLSIHKDPRLSSFLRMGGQEGLRGRNVAVMGKSVYSLLKEYPVERGETDGRKR